MAGPLARTPNHTATSNPPRTHTDVDAMEERKNHHIEFAYLNKDKRDGITLQPRKGIMTRRQARQFIICHDQTIDKHLDEGGTKKVSSGKESPVW